MNTRSLESACLPGRQFGDQLDLDARAERQLRGAERAPRMFPAIAQDRRQQLGRSIGDEVLFGELGGGCSPGPTA